MMEKYVSISSMISKSCSLQIDEREERRQGSNLNFIHFGNELVARCLCFIVSERSANVENNFFLLNFLWNNIEYVYLLIPLDRRLSLGSSFTAFRITEKWLSSARFCFSKYIHKLLANFFPRTLNTRHVLKTNCLFLQCACTCGFTYGLFVFK